MPAMPPPVECLMSALPTSPWPLSRQLPPKPADQARQRGSKTGALSGIALSTAGTPLCFFSAA